VHQDKLAVLGTLNINLDHVYSHLDAAFECRDGVFGMATPVTSVGDNGNVLGIIEKIITQFLCSVLSKDTQGNKC
jgi:hypothetical protein